MKKYVLVSVYVVVLFVLVFGAVGTAFALLFPFKYEDSISASATKYNLDPALVASVINVESGFNARRVSPVGAMGLMQIMPATAVEIAAALNYENFSFSDLYRPEVNIEFGCYYLRYLTNLHDGSLVNVLASYNAGPNKVRAWLLNSTYSPDGQTISKTPYEETNGFIEKVNSSYKIYIKRF